MNQLFPHDRVLGEIGRERVRQIAEEGYRPAHDDGHRRGELAAMAASYLALHVAAAQSGGEYRGAQQIDRAIADDLWPGLLRDRRGAVDRRTLIIAAALVVAELERIDRAAGAPGGHEARGGRGWRAPTVAAIKDAVAARFGVSVGDLVSERRNGAALAARFLAIRLARGLTPYSNAALGRLFARDPTTIAHALERGAARAQSDAAFRDAEAAVRAALGCGADGDG